MFASTTVPECRSSCLLQQKPSFVKQMLVKYRQKFYKDGEGRQNKEIEAEGVESSLLGGLCADQY